MKKKLFLALLTTLLLLLAANAALADSPSDYDCPSCGEPCTEWFPFTATDGITPCHQPICGSCWVGAYEGTARCTFDESTATCTQKPVCSVCGWPDPVNGAVNPNAHNLGKWCYSSSTQHFRFCLDCMATDSYEYEDHYGGTATCTELAICEVCGTGYGDVDTSSHQMTDWACYSTEKHYRYCDLCATDDTYEYEDHYGGTATCNEQAICEGCNMSYGPLDPDTHLTMSDWEPYADGHQRHCLDCRNPDTFERAPHTGDGSCKPACIDCHEIFNDPDGEHDITSWIPTGDGQHVRYCQICHLDETYEYADHVGNGACTSDCQDCGNSFHDPEGEHSLTDWGPYSGDQHARYCELCGLEETFEFGDHKTSVNPDTLPCYKTVTCGDCGFNMCFGTQHTLSEWLPYSPLQHMRYCTVGGTGHVEEYDLHYGGDGSCMPFCEGCGAPYSPLNGTHQWGEWTPNADGTHTRVCALNENHTETADCTFGNWTLADDQYHIRACTDCGDAEIGEHTGGTATCSSPRICDVCHEGYGSPDNSGMTGHSNPVIEQKDPTCYEEGYYRVTCDEPGCTMPFFEIILPTGGQHLYTHWDILGDNLHHTDCAVCGEYEDVACTLWSMMNGETLLTVCPVCGDFLETPFEVLIARDDAAVPIGTLLVRGLQSPFPGALYGFTVAGVYGGEVVDIHGPVSVTLPVDLTELGTFTVVRVDMVDGEELRTEIPFTLEDGLLTIETDTAGLFQLIPAE